MHLSTTICPEIIFVKVFEGNKKMIALSLNECHHEPSGHIYVKYHLVLKADQRGLFTVEYVNTKETIADLLTKILGLVSHTPAVQAQRLSEK